MNDIDLYGDNADIRLSIGDKLVFDEVDNIINLATLEGDPRIAARYGMALRKDARIRGIALAKLLWAVADQWELFQSKGTEDDFYSFVEAEMDIPISTSRVYVGIWDALFANPNVPDEVKERLLSKPIRTLKLLPALASESEVDWNDVISTTTHDEVRQLVRQARGEQTSSKTALFIRLDTRTGQLSAKQGDKPFEPFGVLNMETGSDVCNHAIERIIRDARLMI